MKNIKEKVLKEVRETYEYDDLQFIEVHKPTNTAINIELPLNLAIDLTLAEVDKVIDEWKQVQGYAKTDSFFLAVENLKTKLGIK